MSSTLRKRSNYPEKERCAIRLDHIAYRVADRQKTADFFIKAFGYKIQIEFPLDFGNGETVQCLALEPPEKLDIKDLPWMCQNVHYKVEGEGWNPHMQEYLQEYHLPPEIFVSDGGPDTIVGKWVAKRDGVGGIHHLAYQVDSVEKKMQEWRDKGYAEFLSEKPLQCPGLTQVFTKPSALTGVIYEFIEREEFGFCRENVRGLMESTKNF